MDIEVAGAEGAADVFGEQLGLARQYAQLLRGAGVERGLIGPREVDRLWERHLCNCAVLGELIPRGAHVVDIGSGAGLPGLVLAIARPDLRVLLLDSRLRPTVFLEECVSDLGLASATVRRTRAESVAREIAADVVTARAVTALPRLAEWARPLLRPGGALLAMEGDSADDELAAARSLLSRRGFTAASVVRVGVGRISRPTAVVRAVAGNGRRPDRRRRRR